MPTNLFAGKKKGKIKAALSTHKKCRLCEAHFLLPNEQTTA